MQILFRFFRPAFAGSFEGGEWATLKRTSEGSQKYTGKHFQLHRYGSRWGGTTTKSPDIVGVTIRPMASIRAASERLADSIHPY
jgi:hypothetical protein